VQENSDSALNDGIKFHLNFTQTADNVSDALAESSEDNSHCKKMSRIWKRLIIRVFL